MESLESSNSIKLIFWVVHLLFFPYQFSLQLPIYKNDCIKYILKTLYKLGFDLIYSLITTLLWSNNLGSKESYYIAFILLANKKNQIHFLEDNYFCLIICKYTLVIISQEIKVLVIYKELLFFISMVNIYTYDN